MATFIYSQSSETLTWNIPIKPDTDEISIEWKKTTDSIYELVYHGSPNTNSKNILLLGSDLVARYREKNGGGGWNPFSDPEPVTIVL